MWYIILFFVTLIADQVTKIICDANNVNIPVIEGILRIEIAHNDGAAFSLLKGAQTFFIVLTVVVVVCGVVFLIVKKPKSKWLNTAIALMFSGTIGNFIDRLAFKYVRDFINVEFFANFNVADMCLCVGAGMLVFFVMFLDSDPVINFKKKGKTETEEITQ